MLKKSIKYTDFNGVERNEDFYFNLSKAELMEMQLATDGGLDAKIKEIVNKQNVPEIVSLFKTIILKSVGVKSDDGKRFIKNQDIRDAFEQSEAFSELFMELAANAEKAESFIKAVMPAIPANAQLPENK